MQSETMIAAAGLRDGGLDEGMDTLDFGLTKDPRHRGLLVTAGLGFFHGGVVDQHFNQSRGRLGRLARVTTEGKIHFGFGIDENTAMIVRPEGGIEVVGTGCVTIVDAAGAACSDGPLGCCIRGPADFMLANRRPFRSQDIYAQTQCGQGVGRPGR